MYWYDVYMFNQIINQVTNKAIHIMVFVVDPAKVSMETKHCRGSHNKIERQYRASDLKMRKFNTSIIISLQCIQHVW